MLETFTIDTFKPHIGEIFRVIVDDKYEMITRLGEVTPWGHEEAAKRPRIPFSLTFHARQDAVVQQQIYRIESTVLEPFDCFLVPLGPEGGVMRYEAVFT